MENALQLTKHISDILNCTSIECVWELHTKKMKEIGFDRLLYRSTRFQTHGFWGNFSDAVILSSHDPEVAETFFGKDIFADARMIVWAKENAGVFSWRKRAERFKANDLTEREKIVRALYAKHNIVAGYSITFEETSARSRGAIGLCAPVGVTQDSIDALWAEKGDEILMLNNLVHQKIISLPNTGQRAPLPKRQREILQRISDGETVARIAEALGLAVSTIEKDIRHLRKALGANSTSQAIQKAAILNQIFRIGDSDRR